MENPPMELTFPQRYIIEENPANIHHFVPHKILPLKRADGEPLTRDDIQFDLLKTIFEDSYAVFTDQNPDARLKAPHPKVTFCELYVNAILNSFKCTKVSRDKMLETPSFAVEFSKMCLLVNVGRINTTLAFYPEMRTILRSYHPVPSLMKTAVSERNMMDAPRMKACLKGCLLPSERASPPTTPEAILNKIAAGQRPPTDIVNLIFALSSCSTAFSKHHFDVNMEFLDLFVPSNIPSYNRATAFLWTIFRYLEGPHLENPFNDEFCDKNPNRAPWLPRVSPQEMALWNVDSPGEKEYAVKMKAKRIAFLKQMAREENTIKKVEEPKYITRFHQQQKKRTRSGSFVQNGNVISEVPNGQVDPAQSYPAPQELFHNSPPLQTSFTPKPVARAVENVPPKSTLLRVWAQIDGMDPLADSDEEGADEWMKHEYERRLFLINRARGRELTPEYETTRY